MPVSMEYAVMSRNIVRAVENIFMTDALPAERGAAVHMRQGHEPEEQRIRNTGRETAHGNGAGPRPHGSIFCSTDAGLMSHADDSAGPFGRWWTG